MSQLSRNIFSRGTSASLYPIQRQRRRPTTFLSRERSRIGTRTWILCKSSLFPSGSRAKIFIQSRTTVFFSHASSLCEAVYTSRHPFRHPSDANTPSLSKRFVLLRMPLSLLFNRSNISHAVIPCVLENDLGNTARSTQSATLYIKVNVTSPALYSIPASMPTEDGGPPAEEAPIPGRAQPSPGHPLPLLHHQPVEAGQNKPQSREQVSPAGTEDLRLVLDQADQAMKQIDRSSTWQGAVGRIKWVMDTLSPIAEVRVTPF